jgi:DNA-binding response OmpR family regulator
MRTILIVEDELDILDNNRKALEDAEYIALTAATAARAREILAAHAPDAIVLDIMLPDGNGLDILKELREAGNKTPVIMLTAWGKPSDVARGLKLGANDYLSKPFTYEVLLARVEAMFRNVEQMPDVIEKGRLRLDVMAARAFIGGKDMLLTQKELALLLLFTQHEDRNISAEYLYEKVWKAPMSEDKRTLKKHISTVRKKLGDGNGGYTITAYRGDGYRFEIEN